MGKTYVYDAEWNVAEGDDIVMDAKSLHCVVFKDSDGEVTIFADTDNTEHIPISSLKTWLGIQNDITLIGHNILNADLEVFRRLLDIPFTVGPDTICGKPCTFIDSFTLSKRNNPDRGMEFIYDKKLGKAVGLGIHGLDAWGKRVGIPKPKVTDWSTQPIDVYINRCTEDVKINELAYEMMLDERK